MNIISLQIQTCTKKKKPFHAIKCLQTLAHYRALSSHGPKRIERSDKALRVLDIISSKTRPHASSQLHLRLIQDFLQTDSNDAKHGTHDFASSNSTLGLSNVFDEILESSVFSEENSVSTHFDTHDKGLRLDASVLSIGVSSCGSTRDFGGGIQYHCLAIRCGFAANVYVGSSLISFYSKCCRVHSAYKLFEEMPVRNVVSWTVIIAAFAQEWDVDMCLDLYRRMRDSTLKPNEFTFTSILSACMGSGALGQGRNVHCQTIRMGFDVHIHVANALVSMYCKCGSVDDAFCVFNNIASKDIVSWNSMIAGYAQHGLGIEGIDLFEEMKKQRVKPDAITYLGVLSSCCHAGLVEEGKLCFDSMVEHGLKPELDHYSCVVDLLGRAGLVEEAQKFIERMPIHPNAVIWGSLLSSCRHHGAIWIGIRAAESRLLLEPECAATHVQLANLYASVKCWDQAARVRKSMKDKGLKTRTGYSWVEIKNEVYRFRAEDKSNPRLREILAVLECLIDHMKISGFVPEREVEDSDDALNESL